MIIEVKLPPDSQEVVDKKEWFPIIDGGRDFIVGDSAYARILDESEYILVEKTTADEFNIRGNERRNNAERRKDNVSKDDCMITYNDPGDENEWVNIWINIHYKGDYINIPYNYTMFLWT